MKKNNITVKKSLNLTLIISALILYVLSSLILSPLYVYTASDVVYAVTALPEIIEIAIDIAEIAAYALGFSIIIYSLFRFSLKQSFDLILIYAASVLLRYITNLILTWIFAGSVDPSDIILVVFPFVADMIVFACVLVIAMINIRKYHENRALIEKSNKTLGNKTSSVKDELFSSGKFFSKSNPLQRSALIVGCILSGIKILSRISYDLAYGLPKNLADGAWMVAYYISDILIALIVYAISAYVFLHFASKDEF